MTTSVNEPANDRILAVDETSATLILQYDAVTGLWTPALTTQAGIDTVHDRIHQGRYFSGGYYNAAVANNASIDLLLVLGAINNFHCVMSGAAGGDSLLQIYENTTYSAAGTAVGMTNHNRSSAKVFDGAVTSMPTITAVGDQLNSTLFVPGGQKAQSSGGEGTFSSEFVLKLSTAYLFRLTNISGAAKNMSVLLKGYQPIL
jgi:hypothetical protein